MRFINKYKSYDKLSSIFEKFPLRILKFKSTKWKKIQKMLTFKILRLKERFKRSKRSRAFSKPRRKKFFFDSFLTKVSLKTWYRVEKYYENGRRIKSAVSNMFDKSLPTRYFRKVLLLSKKASDVRHVYSDALLKPEFRLDILLWRLKFFESSYQACQAIDEKRVLVNGKQVNGNFFLSKGDVISFSWDYKLDNLCMRAVRANTLFSKVILTFVEVDYYSNTIIVIKSIKDLGPEDFYLLVKAFYSLKRVKDYI